MGRAIICGSCVVDLPCLKVDLDTPIGANQTREIQPITPSCGGITCNTGIALQRLGVSTSALTYVGQDHWGDFVRQRLHEEGLETSLLHTHPEAPTTAVVVLIDKNGRRSFLAPSVKTATKHIDADFILKRQDDLRDADYFILGYYGRMPLLEPDLPEILAKVRALRCRTVMDSAGDGGDAEQLKRILPHLDIYVPSEAEASRQACTEEPEKMIHWFRQYNHDGIVGVKLGERGALLHCPEEGFLKIDAKAPPSPVLDTTGAGDCFTAGLVAGLDQGLSVKESGAWAAAAGALAVTAHGGHQGLCGLAALQEIL